MATKTVLLNPQYFSEIKNGSNFSLNTGDFAPHLLGGFTEKMRFTATVQISNRINLRQYDVQNDVITLTDGQNFLNEDFYAGGTAILSLNASSSNYRFDIDYISADGSEMGVSNVVFVDDAGVTGGATNLPEGSLTDDILRDLSPSEGLKMKFNFIGNNDNISFVSATDQVEQAFKFDQVRSTVGPVTGVWDSAVQGSKTGGATAEFIGDISDGGVIKSIGNDKCPQGSIQEFQIVQDFVYGPYYLQGEISDISGPFRPERITAQDLRHVIDFEFTSELSNPNTKKLGRWDVVKGKTNYFGENYIDQPQTYSIDSLDITDLDTGLPANEISLTSANRVVFSVLDSSNSFVATHPIVSYHSTLPTSNNYTNQVDDFQTVWNYETLRTTIQNSPTPVAGQIITNFTAEFINAGRIDVSYDLSFNAAQQARASAGDNYVHGVVIGDDTLTTVFSNKTPLVVEVNQYIENTDVPGLVTFGQTRFLRHADNLADPDHFSELKGWVQDPFLYDWEFDLDVGNLGAVLDSLVVRLVALKVADNTFFELDSVIYDLSTQTVVPGPPETQQIIIDTTRGFPLADGDPMNFVQMETDVYAAPFQKYTGRTAFIVNWQDWQNLPGADAVFYDPSQPFDGFNKKASRYSLQNGYEIRVLLDLGVSQNPNIVEGVDPSNVTNYIDKSFTMTIRDYGEQDGSPVTWTTQEQVFTLSGDDTNGVILKNQDTIAKATFIPDVAFGPDPVDYRAWVAIEENDNPGTSDQKLSSFRVPGANIILIGPDAMTNSKIEVVSGNIELSAQIDHTKLDPGKDYDVTWKLELVDGTIPAIPQTYKDVNLVFKSPTLNAVYGQQDEQMFNAELIGDYFKTLDIDNDITYRTQAGTDPGPGGWGPANNVTPNTFAQFASELADNSSLWYQLVIDNQPVTSIYGAVLRYRVLVDLPETQTVDISWNVNNEVDLERVFYFDTIVEFSNLVTNTSVIRGVYCTLMVLADSDDSFLDYQFSQVFPFDNISDLNTAISLLSEGTKYYVSIFPNRSAGSNVVTTIDIEFLNRDDLLFQKALDYRTNLKYRAFGQSYLTNATGYGELSPPGSALNDFFDNSQGANAFSVRSISYGVGISFWQNNGGSGGSFTGISMFRFQQYYLFYFGNEKGPNEGILIRWDLWNNTNMYNDILLTYDGSRTAAGVDLYVNGIKPPVNAILMDNMQPTTVTLGSDNASTPTPFVQNLLTETPDTAAGRRIERLEIYDVKLTDADYRRMFVDPSYNPGNRIRQWLYNGIVGTNIPETDIGENGTIQGDGAPVLTDFQP